jgi:SAM-dependent methyltransferase
MNELQAVEHWYNDNYRTAGLRAQRFYPNEELLRFFGRHFFHSTSHEDRSALRVLEIGCGTCANLWMVAREGFDAYGIDLSEEAIRLGRETLARWETSATLKVGSMTAIPFPDEQFDVVCDVLSSCCLIERDLETCLAQVSRVLRPGGLFFSYTFSAESDAFKNHSPSQKLDDWTLDGVRRPGSPYEGNLYPFRFTTPQRYSLLLDAAGLEVRYMETIGRTYNSRTEYFEYIGVTAVKP